MISKIRKWWKDNFPGYRAWREVQNEFHRQMESERIFNLATVEYMLREDFPRHQILDLLRKNQTPTDRHEIETIMRILGGGSLPPDCVQCPVIDFPLTKETMSNENETNGDRVPEGSRATL